MNNTLTDNQRNDLRPVPALFDPFALDNTLAQGQEMLGTFRATLKSAAAALHQHFLDGADAAALVLARSRTIDALVTRAWRHFMTGPDHGIALIAVGGYGRGELLPGSDIDLMILLDSAAHEHRHEAIENFLTFLWDIGLEVGHSVRDLAQCVDEAQRDITVATNIMEARLLAGPATLFEAMRDATGPEYIWPIRDFFAAKLREQTTRHHKFHDTAYKLEPNVKESPGGLRDIQMIGWVAKRHFGAETLAELVQHGFLTPAEYQSLVEGQNYLWRVRMALHLLSGRREDRLLFDHQRALARQFGYQDEEMHLAVEQFMKRYYRTVMELNRLNEMLLQHFEEDILYADDSAEPVAINKRFQARKGYLEVTYTKVFQHYPFALMELFLVLAQNPDLKGVRAATIRLVRDHRHLIDDKFRNDLRARTLFMEILRQPHGVNRTLRRMNRYGVLAEYLPLFGQIVGQMQYDLFHIYTVDEHTMFMVRNLRRFTVPANAQEFPLCSRIMQALPKPELLYLAGLFHDIAKGRGGDHSELGSKDAEAFCLHHGLSNYDSHLVAWLVQNHLVMSTTAQRRDISDPLVVNEFANRVGDRVRLNYLYLLTVADIRATNPELWNNWKDALLIELYRLTMRALRRGLENPLHKDELIRETQEQARELLHAQDMDDARIDSVWHDLSEDYFLRYSSEEIAWHTDAIAHCNAQELPLVLLRLETARGGSALFLHARSDDHLFALTTSVLDQLGLTILDARLISALNGHTMDTYLVLEDSGEPIANDLRAEEILDTLNRELRRDAMQAPAVTRHAPRTYRHFDIPTVIDFSQDDRNRRTVVELTTADRPGLLSRVGSAFQACGVRVQNAKVATFGARAEDFFFITDAANRPISDTAQLEQLRAALLQHLTE
jgi:[protein-PII] uridylyltransferase